VALESRSVLAMVIPFFRRRLQRPGGVWTSAGVRRPSRGFRRDGIV